MLNQNLSARRELVELLDTEPLFDYLLQNGAVKPSVVDDIKEEKSQVQANIALLKNVENNGKTAQNLFINALRQTGQHYLANLLDDGIRIKALSGSGYLSKNRHRGQVTVQILVEAFKLIPESLAALGLSMNREWLSLEDIQISIATLRKPKKKKSPEKLDFEEAEREPKKSCGFCGCFTRMFSRNKSSKKYQANGTKNSVQSSNNVESPDRENNLPELGDDIMSESILSARKSSLLDESLLSMNSKSNVENLRSIAHVIQEKSEEFYELFSSPTATPRIQLLKYFEQSRGILVLDSSYVDGIALVSICTKPDQLDDLRRDYDSGKLATDVEEWVVTNDVLEGMGVTGIRLKVDINREDIETAEQELAS